MSSGNTKDFYKKKDKVYQKINSYRDKNNKSYKTKSDVLTNNLNYSQNPYVYIKLDPEYLENNYQNEEKKFVQNYITDNYIDNKKNIINNNSTNENNFKKKYPYLKNQRNTTSPIKSKNNHLLYENKTLDENNRKRNSFNDNNSEYKTVSPIKKYIEKKNFNFYINNRIYTQGNNNIKKEIYLNKSTDINKLHNNRYNYNNIDDKYNYIETQRSVGLPHPKINIYQKKMINIFVQIINKIIEKHKKNDSLISFFNKLKKNSQKNASSKYKYQKKNTKYNEYKNIMNKYVKTNNKGNELIKNKINNNKKIINERNNNLRAQKTDFNQNDKKRLKELKKKYEKIYEKRKNSTIPFDDKYLNYMLRKTKTQYNLSKNNQSSNNESFIEQIKTKLLKSKLINNANSNRNKQSQRNLRQRIYPYSNSKMFNSFSKYPENLGDISSNNINNKGIITKKLKITPKLSKNIKEEKENLNNKNEQIYTIYNIKDIVTSDKRLYVYINYITLNNIQKEKDNILDYYNNDLLRVSNALNISLDGWNKKSNKNKSSNYLTKQPKYLSKIEEEPYDKYYNTSNKDKENDITKKYDNLEKPILILEKYKKKLKKETIKKNIINYKKKSFEKSLKQ